MERAVMKHGNRHVSGGSAQHYTQEGSCRHTTEGACRNEGILHQITSRLSSISAARLDGQWRTIRDRAVECGVVHERVWDQERYNSEHGGPAMLREMSRSVRLTRRPMNKLHQGK